MGYRTSSSSKNLGTWQTPCDSGSTVRYVPSPRKRYYCLSRGLHGEAVEVSGTN
jgi:hypothetical protein